jgi:hypothetical protein
LIDQQISSIEVESSYVQNDKVDVARAFSNNLTNVTSTSDRTCSQSSGVEVDAPNGSAILRVKINPASLVA